MPSTPVDPEVLALVHQGWDHLKRQNPLAAWATWQRALKRAPDAAAARQALDVLANADDLPAAARSVYRFRPPLGDDRRARWNDQFQGRDLGDLPVAADAFRALALADDSDAAARFNLALCLAWQGKNTEAIETIDAVVSLEAELDPDSAVVAWTLAEILRQGGGAEPLADDLSHAVVIPWSLEDGEPTRLADPGLIRALAAPPDPLGIAPASDVQIYEWLDRPMPEPSATQTADDLPTVLATLVRSEGTLRLSTPDPLGRFELEQRLEAAIGDDRPVQIESTPLPLTLLDADLWTVKLPMGLDDSTRRRLLREAVENYFENEWVQLGRLGLGQVPGVLVGVVSGLTPLGAGRLASAGDAVARAKLTAVIRVREQLAARPRVAGLYAGYPFDRLRRRVGLDPDDPRTIEPNDYTCMGERELEELDPAALNESALVDAYRSASALLLDDVAARMAAALVERDPSALVRLDAPNLVQTLARHAWTRGEIAEALAWLDRAEALGESQHPEYEATRAEIQRLAGDPDAAMESYRGVLGWHPNWRTDSAVRAVEAAERLRSGGYPEHARRLTAWANELARLAETVHRSKSKLGDEPGDSPS